MKCVYGHLSAENWFGGRCWHSCTKWTRLTKYHASSMRIYIDIVLLPFKEVFQKNKNTAGFNSRGLGRHLGLRRNALASARSVTEPCKVFRVCVVFYTVFNVYVQHMQARREVSRVSALHHLYVFHT